MADAIHPAQATLGNSGTNINWGPLLTSTFMKYIDSGMLHDQIFKGTALLDWLYSGGRIKKLDGGERISLGIMFDGSGNFKRYTGGETLDTTRGTGRTRAFFNWKQAATTAGITGLDQRSNMGESRIRDMAKDAIMQAEMTLADNLATDFFSDGSADSSKQSTGLAAMVATTTTSGTYAEIDFGANTAWRNQVDASVGAGAVNLLPSFRSIFNSCLEGKNDTSGPDFIVTTQAIAEIAESIIQPSIRYTPGGSGEMSSNPMFRGAEIKWDSHCQSGVYYALNSKHIFLFTHRDADMTMPKEGFQRPVNQDELSAQILWQGNLGTNNRRKLGKGTGVT